VSHITDPRAPSDDVFGDFIAGQPSRRATRHSRSGRSGGGGPGRYRWLYVLLTLLLVVALATVGGVLFIRHKLASYDANIERFQDPTAAIPAASRPAPAKNDALNLLLLGSDSRISAGDPSQWVAGAQRTDAIMLVHIPADRKGAYVVSIPRDSWVDVPGHGDNKINAGFSFGGPALMVQTVEQLTDVRIDHIVIADFEGFKDLTDTLGGVTITVPKSTKDERAEFPAGTYRMDGETALNYVRQRHNLPGGDFDREKRQQNWIRAVLKEMVSKGTLSDPVKVDQVLDQMTKSISTDDSFTLSEMRDLALSMRDLRSNDVAFMTAPVAGTGRSPDGKQSIVRLDQEAGVGLWKSVKDDAMVDWIEKNRPALLGGTVR
jgi:LCP family protein required for cell wall assembly